MLGTNIITILAPGNLIIWLPGLLFVSSLVYSSLTEKGATSRATRIAPLGLFIIAVCVAFLIPQQEMAKAIRFANTHTSHIGAPVASYAAIDYAAKAAWFMTALPIEERGEESAVGGDLFNFEDVTVSEETRQEQTGAPDVVSGEAEGPVYQPEKNVAWALLIVFLIVGSLFFLKDVKTFSHARR